MSGHRSASASGGASVTGVADHDEPALSFGEIADDYDRLRPGPPELAVDWLLPAHCRVAIDVGAGTGLLTRALARRVAQVIAVEPDERMAAVLRTRSPGVRVLPGSGEAIPVPDGSADGVFVSSAWHWMDPPRAVPEIARALRDGGRFGVIWTSLDREADWLLELRRPTRPPPAEPDAGQAAQERAGHHEVLLPEAAPFGHIATASFAFTRTMAISDLVNLLATYSMIITASPADRAAGLARARAALQERFPGADEVEVPMRARCWRADRVPRR
jgi:SAM-dependent methyltransferase